MSVIEIKISMNDSVEKVLKDSKFELVKKIDKVIDDVVNLIRNIIIINVVRGQKSGCEYQCGKKIYKVFVFGEYLVSDSGFFQLSICINKGFLEKEVGLDCVYVGFLEEGIERMVVYLWLELLYKMNEDKILLLIDKVVVDVFI